MRLRMLALRFGEIPPARGPQRDAYLMHHGTRSLREAKQQFGLAVREANAALAGVGEHLPEASPPINVRPGLPTPLPAVIRRRAEWDHLQSRLARHPEQRLPGEDVARAALRSAADSLNYLEDTPRADEAHCWVHRCGELVGGLYGCFLDHRDDGWYRTCPVRIAHLRFGNSVGFTARRLCSICGEDISECPHTPGDDYEVTARKAADGRCSICDRDGCDHAPGRIYEATATTQITDLNLHEISVVPRPLDPLCRMDAIEITEENLIAGLGRRPDLLERIACFECVGVCSGFVSFEQFRGQQ